MLVTLDNINEVAKYCWEHLGSNRVLAIHGLMGAGKTTLIHALCEVKGVKDAVGSPTFSIINEYFYDQGGKTLKIYHIDLYRLKDGEEARRAGVEECLYSDHTCLVEWPERAPELFPPGTVHLYIEVISSEIRRLVISRN